MYYLFESIKHKRLCVLFLWLHTMMTSGSADAYWSPLLLYNVPKLALLNTILISGRGSELVLVIVSLNGLPQMTCPIWLSIEWVDSND